MAINGKKHPMFGRKSVFRGSVPSIDKKWHVNLYDVSIYFLGVKLVSFIEEKMERGPVSSPRS